jgi:putative sterol carrier protein
MMAFKFLSEEWIAKVHTVVGSSDAVKTVSVGLSCKVQVVVTNVPHGEVHYWFNVKNGTVAMGLGDLDDADCTMTQNYDTAVAIDKGELTVSAAFMQGKIEFTGNMAKVMEAMPPIAVSSAVIVTVEGEY